MKTLLTTLILAMLALPVYADQQTTVLQEQATVAKAQAVLPYIDGSNSTEMEKLANALIRTTATDLAKEVGGGNVTYKVMLNRPSLVSLLLEARNGNKLAYKGLNIDLTTGREFTVTDFFVDNEEVQAALGDYENVLFGEEGLYIHHKKYAAYDTCVPYSKVLKNMRIGEAGRIMQVAKLTAAANGKTLVMPKGGLLALKLDSNPSTGYGWSVNADAAVQKVGSSFTIPRAEEARVGTPGTEILFLAVQQPGTHQVKLEYQRAWERISLQSITFTVQVAE